MKKKIVTDDGGYKSRKFLLTVGIVLLSTLLLSVGLVIEATWKDVVMAVFSVFMMGHVGEKWVMKDANKNGIDDELESVETEESITTNKKVTVTKKDDHDDEEEPVIENKEEVK